MKLALFLPAALALASAQILAAAPAAAPIATLARAVSIPYETFTLPNGLTVVVHTDRKAPVVAVSVWYHVGSKDEPAGQTGFAHLYEHLMFYGSENVPGSFFEPLEQIGATDMNGSTANDRTNYFETVPTPALAYTLFLESDRMGHLLGALDQKRLDAQRAVVQNEKRQNDNQPYGLVDYAQLAALFPADHPYRHPVIGSMADLDAAGLATVKTWYRLHYGPNNAALVLAGDIDLATARPLVERYFGDIPAGPKSVPAAAPVPTLPARKDETIHDDVATTRLYRDWVVPGRTDDDAVALDIAASILGGLASSRLDDVLVRGEKLAVGVSASLQPLERVGLFEASVDVTPGADPATAGKRLDAIIADLIANGPTQDEVDRAVTREIADRIRGLESVGGFGGKAVALAEGQLYAGDPGFSRKQLARYAALTPATVRAAARKWLSRPVYALTVAPGPRGAYQEAKAAPPSTPAIAPSGGSAAIGTAKRVPPAVGDIADLRFPAVERARLANGATVVYARRAAVPLTRVALSFDAGNAADPRDRLGTQSLLLALLDEGTAARGAQAIAAEEERLGAAIGAAASMDRTSVQLAALTANLAPSLDLLADIVRNPALDAGEIERVRVQQLARIREETSSPQAIALRTLPPLLYGPAHPYGVPFTGTGDPAAVARVTRADLLAFKDAWLRPDRMTVFVVSDRPLAEVLPLIDRGIGGWRASPTPAGVKDFAVRPPPPRPRILLIDRPGAPQSMILAGEILPGRGSDELLPLLAANDVLGGGILSRISLDLREAKGWAYGAGTSVYRVLDASPLLAYAPVQTNRTGPAIAALRADMQAYLTTSGVTAPELARTVNSSVRALAGAFETGGQVLGGMQRNLLYGRPDDYYDHIADRYRALTAPGLDAVARAAIDPAKLVWVVVGDAASVAPQLGGLGLPVETVKAQ